MKHTKPNTSNNHAGYIAWKGWDADHFGAYTKADQLEFTWELRNAGIRLSSTTRVLEIGFGNGAFAGWVRQLTTHYTGIEANQELVDRALRAGMHAYPATLDIASTLSDRPYDVIVAFDVLEHMDFAEIVELLKSCHKCLSKGGVLLIRVPSGDSPFAGPLFNGDVTHRTLLGSRAFAQLSILTGFELVSTRDTTLPVFGLGPKKALERAMVKLARKLTSFFIKAAFLGNKHAVITSNMVVVLKPQP